MPDIYKDLTYLAEDIDDTITNFRIHEADKAQHTTAAERDAWNNKADASTVYTKSEIDTALNGKVDKITGKGLSTNDYTTNEKTKLASLANYDDTAVLADIVAIKTEQATQNTALFMDRATLVELVNNGAKNRVIIGFPVTTKNTVTATPNADGTITIDGTNNSSSSTILVFDLYANASASTDNKQNPFLSNGKYIFTGSGSNSVRVQLCGYNDDLKLNVLANSADDVEVTIDGTYKYYVFRIWIAGSASFDNVKLYPMCCLKAYHDVSNEFRPYIPTNAELYEMIKAM